VSGVKFSTVFGVGLHFFVLSDFELDSTACDYFQCHKISFQRLKAGTQSACRGCTATLRHRESDRILLHLLVRFEGYSFFFWREGSITCCATCCPLLHRLNHFELRDRLKRFPSRGTSNVTRHTHAIELPENQNSSKKPGAPSPRSSPALSRAPPPPPPPPPRSWQAGPRSRSHRLPLQLPPHE
jgi:hypothetical protein